MTEIDPVGAAGESAGEAGRPSPHRGSPARPSDDPDPRDGAPDPWASGDPARSNGDPACSDGDPDPRDGARVRRPRPDGSDRPETDRYDVSQDDLDLGWGERATESGQDDWYRRERPPHHGG